jgi:hypothetical protein
LSKLGIVRKNVRIDEQMETQSLANSAQDQTAVSSITPLDPEVPEDGGSEAPPQPTAPAA